MRMSVRCFTYAQATVLPPLVNSLLYERSAEEARKEYLLREIRDYGDDEDEKYYLAV